MNNRPLGKTGIEVSEIGFGAWQLGNEKDWGKMDDQEAVSQLTEGAFSLIRHRIMVSEKASPS